MYDTRNIPIYYTCIALNKPYICEDFMSFEAQLLLIINLRAWQNSQ